MSLNWKWSKMYDSCIRCGTTTSKHKAKGLCVACYQKEHVYPKEICSICGLLSRVHKRINHNPICSKCYKEPEHQCKICGRITSVALKLNEYEYVCDKCYTKFYRSKHKCSICGEFEILAVNSGNIKICKNCYKPVHNKCFKCGRNIKSPYVINGNHACNRCYEIFRKGLDHIDIDVNSKQYKCTLCGKPNDVKKVFPDSSVMCQSCFITSSKICISCNNPLLNIHSYLKALPYCRRCYYKQKFNSLFESISGQWNINYKNILINYFDYKVQKTSYENIYMCINHSESILSILNSSFEENKEVFHPKIFIEFIKSSKQKRLFINDLIGFLCSENLMCEYDKGFTLLVGLDNQINILPQSLRNVITSYREYLLNLITKYREKGWCGKNQKLSYYTCYLYILTALRFLNYIYKSLNMNQFTQINNHNVDEFLSLNNYDKGNLKHFIKFINTKKLTFMKLVLPDSNYRHELLTGLEDNKQIELFNKCTSSDNYSLKHRVIVLLMLIYGIRPKEIQKLYKTDFTIKESRKQLQVYFHFNKIARKLPAALNLILLQYLQTLENENTFVFPGRLCNTPISLSYICNILSNFGVTATELHYTAINNAMLNGLYQPALIMKNFGINHTTATRYFNLIKNME